MQTRFLLLPVGRSYLEEDANNAFNGDPARVAATTPQHPGTALLTKTTVPARQEGVGTLTTVANRARNPSSQAVATTELAQSSERLLASVF